MRRLISGGKREGRCGPNSDGNGINDRQHRSGNSTRTGASQHSTPDAEKNFKTCRAHHQILTGVRSMLPSSRSDRYRSRCEYFCPRGVSRTSKLFTFSCQTTADACQRGRGRAHLLVQQLQARRGGSISSCRLLDLYWAGNTLSNVNFVMHNAEH